LAVLFKPNQGCVQRGIVREGFQRENVQQGKMCGGNVQEWETVLGEIQEALLNTHTQTAFDQLYY